MSSIKSINVKADVQLTKEQYRDLITMCRIANDVLGILGDVMPDKKYKRESIRMGELEEYLFKLAGQFDSSDLVEDFMGKAVMDEDYYEGFIRELVDAYDDYVFWHELETRMGKRDFERTKTEEEEKKMSEEGGWYPERIHELYEKYREEFEKRGIERLEFKDGVNRN